MSGACWFEGCPREQRARGYCNGHLEQQRRGRPMAPLRILPRYAWTYVVYWPDALAPGIGVLKVGRAWSRWRVKRMVDKGAVLISNTGNTDETWERWALRLLATEYAPAFASAAEAAGLLYRGQGWTECFAVPDDEVFEAMDLCIEGYALGNERGANDPTDYLPRRSPRPVSDERGSEEHDRPTGAEQERQGCPMVSDAAAGAMVTARALWLMADHDGRLRIDVDRLAAKLFPFDEPTVGRDQVETHVLMLEDAGHLTTYATGEGEWLQLHQPVSEPDPAPPGPAPTPGIPGPDSTPSGREREGVRARESDRMSACESRARERVQAERDAATRAWAARREQRGPRAARPRRPASLDAPPMGCAEHPHGAPFPCGPCGSARREYDAFLDASRYESQLATWEFWNGSEDEEVLGDDGQPF